MKKDEKPTLTKVIERINEKQCGGQRVKSLTLGTNVMEGLRQECKSSPMTGHPSEKKMLVITISSKLPNLIRINMVKA